MKRFALSHLGLSALVSVAALAVTSSSVLAQETPSKEKGQDTDKGKHKGHDKDHQPESKDKGKDKGKDAAKKGGVAPGDAAPNFTLVDTDGKEHNLSSATQEGKIVVLQWFNPDCPFVVKHYGASKTFNDLAKTYADKGVVFYAINSGAKGKQGAGKNRNVKAKTDWEIAYPILLDESGETGKAYGAQRSPDMVVIGKDGRVAYFGAIDDDYGADKPGKVNYVAKALDEILAGKPVTTSTTKGYGCSVKY